MSDDVKCQFCGEDGFDLQGVKLHLENGHCEPYNALNTPAQEFQQDMERRRKLFEKRQAMEERK